MKFSIDRTDDVQTLSVIACATFLQTYAHMIAWPDIVAHNRESNSPEYFQELLDEGSAAWRVTIEETKTPIGFALLGKPDLPMELNATDIELRRIYILHRFHREGLGRRLLDQVETEARARAAERIVLGVYHENPTMTWYRRQGFEEIGTRAFTVGTETFHDLILGKGL